MQQHIGDVLHASPPATPQSSLRVVLPPNPVYPNLNFSVLNEGNTPVQITSIKVIKAASVVDNHTGVERLLGTRHKLEWSLQAAQTGTWSEVFGEDLIASLAPGESEAFQLRLACENAVSLVDIAVEFVAAGRPDQGVVLSDQIIAVHAPVQSVHGRNDNGCITCIPRDVAFDTLVDGRPLEVWRGRDYADCSAHLTAIARAAAFVCLGSLEERWEALCEKYDGSPSFGVMVTSLAELGATFPLPASLADFASNWAARPGNLGLVPVWDEESLPQVLLHALGHQVYSSLPRGQTSSRPPDERSRYLEILDQSLEIWTFSEEDSDFSSFMQKVAVMQGQRAALGFMIEAIGLGATEILVALCCLEPIAVHTFHELLIETLKHRAGNLRSARRIVKDSEAFSMSDDEKFAEFWLTAWQQLRGVDAFQPPNWRPCCPRLAAAFTAYSTNSGTRQLEFTAHPDPYVRQAMARNPRATPATLALLANDREKAVRFFVAKNAETGPDALRRLAGDSDSIIRRWIAVHPNADDGTLMGLATDHSPNVRSMLQRRASFLGGG